MTCTVRNTLVLFIMLLTVIVSGEYMVAHRLLKTVETAAARLHEEQEKLALLRENNRHFDRIKTRLEEIKNSWRKLPKHVYEKENSAVSFGYFNSLASLRDSRLNFNFRINRIAPEKRGSVTMNIYTVNGDAPFSHFFRFLWRIEHNETLYTVDEVTVEPVTREKQGEKPGGNRVQFVLALRGYSFDQTGLEKQESAPKAEPPVVGNNPFYPLARKNLPPNNENLLNVSGAVLLGLSGETAYLTDSAGKIWTVRAGNRVYLGKTVRVDADNQSVEFLLNEGGFVRSVRLHLDYKNRSDR